MSVQANFTLRGRNYVRIYAYDKYLKILNEGTGGGVCFNPLRASA